MSPLRGITVVTLEQAVAAPFASRHLADLGARVIKIERPDGGDFARDYDKTVLGQSSHFIWLNRGKESIALNIKSSAGQEIVGKLLESADVFLQNLSPGAIQRLGLEGERLRATYPRLIIGNINGYGSGGPYSERKAYDLLVQAETGVLAVTGSEQEPAKAGIPVADIAAGMYMFSGILAALLQRQQTGSGDLVSVSMFDALTEWMGYPMLYTKYGGKAPSRSGAAHAAIAPYGPFQAGDGGTVVLAVQNQREWYALCEKVLRDSSIAGDSRFVDNTARVRNRDDLEEVINHCFAALTLPELVRLLDDAGIAFAKMNTVEDLIAHPQLLERSRWQEITTPKGNMQAVRPVLGSVPNGEVPALGQHSRAVLSELGYSAEKIEQWLNDGTIV